MRNQLTAERSRLNTERQQAETRIDERLNELETSFERMTSRERERFRQWRDAHEEVLYDERRKYPPRVHNDQYQRDMAGLLEHEVGGPQAPVMQRHKASDSGGLGFSDSFGGEVASEGRGYQVSVQYSRRMLDGLAERGDMRQEGTSRQQRSARQYQTCHG